MLLLVGTAAFSSVGLHVAMDKALSSVSFAMTTGDAHNVGIAMSVLALIAFIAELRHAHIVALHGKRLLLHDSSGGAVIELTNVVNTNVSPSIQVGMRDGHYEDDDEPLLPDKK